MAATSDEEEFPPRIGRFLVFKVVGTGGMGQVFARPAGQRRRASVIGRTGPRAPRTTRRRGD